MKSKLLLISLLMLSLALALGACAGDEPTTVGSPPEQDPAPPSPPEVELSGSVPEGGRLYDKWWKAAGVDEPAGDQPLWASQSTNSRSGADSWRDSSRLPR